MPESTVLWRYRRKAPGHVGPQTVRPVRCIRDDAEGLAAWLAPETEVLRPVLSDGRELRSVPATEMFRAGRVLRRDRWQGPGILMITPTGVPWSVWCFWDPDGLFRGWYVNLEDPHERNPGRRQLKEPQMIICRVGGHWLGYGSISDSPHAQIERRPHRSLGYCPPGRQ